MTIVDALRLAAVVLLGGMAVVVLICLVRAIRCGTGREATFSTWPLLVSVVALAFVGLTGNG